MAKRKTKHAKSTGRKKGHRKGRKHRSAAQKAATKRMLAANRQKRAAKGHTVTGTVVKVRARKERISGVRSLTRRVENLESFAHQQKRFNGAVRDAMVRVYRHTKLATPSQLLKGPALH
jgi:hypothetical protein